MGKHARTLKLIELATEILAAEHPMTVRQVYYPLVSRQAVETAARKGERYGQRRYS